MASDIRERTKHHVCSCGTSHNSQQQKNVPYALSYEDHIRFQEVYSQGVIDRIANDTLGALKMFEQAAKLNPKSAAANYQLGCVMKAIAFERIDTLMSLRADSLIFLATQQAPDNYEYLETWTDRELNEGHLEEALPLLCRGLAHREGVRRVQGQQGSERPRPLIFYASRLFVGPILL